MSVLDDFMRAQDLRKRAAEYERAAIDLSLPSDVRTRYVLIANHYRVVSDGKSGQSALAGVQRQLVGQLVKYRRTTRLRLNKCLGDDLAPPLPATMPISDNTRIIYGRALGCAQLRFSRCFSPDRFGWPQRSLAL